MNLRQKYKKAKRELEFYRNQSKRDYTFIKRENVPIQTLCRTRVIPWHTYVPTNFVDNLVRDELLNDARNFIKIEHDIRADCTMVRGTIELIDRSKPMQMHDGMKINVAMVDEEHELYRAHYFQEPIYKTDTDEEDSSFTKEQLWPRENPYLKEE